MGVQFFIAKRIYNGSGGGKSYSRPAVVIALWGVAVGLAIMIVSLAVVLGFKREVSSKVVGFGSHVQLLSNTQNQYFEVLPVQTTDSLLSVTRKVRGVEHVQQFATRIGMLKTEDDFLGVTFKGVGEDYDTTFLHQSMVEGCIPPFSASAGSNQLLISATIARNLGLSVGDRVFAYFLGSSFGVGENFTGESVEEAFNSETIDPQTLRARRYTVAGIYETHLSEYDKVYVFTDIKAIRKLNNWDDHMSSGLEINVTDYGVDGLRVARTLNKRVCSGVDKYGVSYASYYIKEMAPHVFSWLSVLDTNVLMIIILMICVATFTVVSGILIIMLERIQMIGILKALGADNLMIRGVFLRFAAMFIGTGLVLGNVLGVGLCYIQQHFRLVSLDADVYYLDTVPVLMDWSLVALLNVVTIVIAMVVIFGSTFFISLNEPARSIHYE